MPAVTASVTLRISGELLERVDRLVATSRNAWLLWVIEEAVKRAEIEGKYSPSTRAVERALGDGGRSATGGSSSPAPAEQPEVIVERRGESLGSASGGSLPVRPAREFRPYPKGGG